MNTVYKIPESFFYSIPERIYFTYDGYYIRYLNNNHIHKREGYHLRDEILKEIKYNNIIYIGQV